MQNPFQSADLKELPWWQGIALHERKNAVFDALAGEMHAAFEKALEDGRLRRFSVEYHRLADVMMAHLPDEPLLPAILAGSSSRLTTIFCYLRQRQTVQRPLLDGETSVLRWQLSPQMLSDVVAQADHMLKAEVTHQKFDIKASKGLMEWVFDVYWPVVREFCGIAASPVAAAHLRCISSEKSGNGYRERFQHHRFGNHHFDQDVYSLPLIIYLGEVTRDSGPFEYLDASYRYANNYILRAFHQALNHDCGISSLEQGNFAIIGRLPAVFRGGDVVGNFYSQSAFEKAGPVAVSGGIGTAVLFDGFHVMHAGGFPTEGSRKSLFVNFRFPVAKLIPRVRSMFINKWSAPSP